MSGIKPDVIVAIDLGMTYTGVGWARPLVAGALQSPIQVIHNWPGSLILNEQKVKTVLSYTPQGLASSWGFLCDEDGTPGRIVKEFFKIFLDQAVIDNARAEGLNGAPTSTAEAQKLISDYLSHIYRHIKSTLEVQGIGTQWNELAIEFIFSVPTTWRTHSIVNAFKSTIREAGFGIDGPSHHVVVEMTESEAAAVATIKAATVYFQRGDIFIVVDAGGGTTDCAVMQVLDANVPFPRLAQVTEVDGIGIGSTVIDAAFGALVRQRIEAFPELVKFLPDNCIEMLVRGDAYKRTKHRFGDPTFTVDVYSLPLDGVGFNYSYPPAGIEQGKILISRQDIQALFDLHIDKILTKIREQLDWAQKNLIGQQVNYMVLSGGLGSSRYVRDRLEQAIRSQPHPSAVSIQILQAPDPQLVVVKGLLLDRLQRLDSGAHAVLVHKRARSSYGVVTESAYDPILHAGCKVRKDPFDGRLYALEQISWMIRKGDIIDPEIPIIRKYFQYISKAKQIPSWNTRIVQSHMPRDLLPRSLDEYGVQRLCTVTSSLTGVKSSQLQKHRKPSKSCLLRGEKYFSCDFHIHAIIGAVDLKFELWFEGQKFSGNHEPIKVDWEQ